MGGRGGECAINEGEGWVGGMAGGLGGKSVTKRGEINSGMTESTGSERGGGSGEGGGETKKKKRINFLIVQRKRGGLL